MLFTIRNSMLLALGLALAASAAAGQQGPEKGSLVIVGGALRDNAILERFISLAGGPEAPIVIIPTAGGEDDYDAWYAGARRFRNLGATNITVLHTWDREEAESEEFAAPITKARGVWFPGGRQWRLVDAYADTRTERELHALLARGGKAVERLFQRRDGAKERLGEDDAALERAKEEVKRVDRRVEAARTAERAASDRHHDLSLEERELGGKIVLIRERVETEWARPFEKLVEMSEPVEGDPAELKEELAGLVQRIERLGPVNMLAIEEHAEQHERLTVLTGQRDDLDRARNDLRAAIREIDQTATRLFLETFEAARQNFRRIHQRLFEGGECDLRLGDPDDPLGGPVDIHASPMGKRTRRIDLLSGGERALTALALLFGIYLVKPSPFCVLDEVDAPLDENNIDRFVQLLREFKQQSQFVVITHNPRTIEAADWIYGLTMEEPGVSSVVGVRLEAGASA